MRRTKIGRVVVSVGAVAALWGGAAMFGGPAQASPPTGRVIAIFPGVENCPRGMFCVWAHPNYTGPGVAFEGNADHWHHLPHGLEFIDDQASSAFNNGTTEGGVPSKVLTFNDVGYRGTKGCMSAGARNPRLQPQYNDKISSHKWSHSC
jgi:hypothetical protein